MTGLDTTLKYQTYVNAAVRHTADMDWATSIARSEATDTERYACKLLRCVLVGENTSESPGISANWLLRSELMRIEQAKEDERWPGAVRPAAQAFEEAYTFISRLPLATIPVPEVSVADDGEINFQWSRDGVYVDLGLYGTGKFSYFAHGRDGERIRDDDVPITKGLPSGIAALFEA